MDQNLKDANDAIARHLGWLMMSGMAATTITARRGALRRCQRRLPVPLHRATRAQLLEWRSGLRVAPNTIISEVSHVRAFFAWLAGEDGTRRDNPAVRIPVPPAPGRVPHPIGEDDLARAVGSAPDRIRVALILAGWCGLRAKEIARLRRRFVREFAASPHIFIAADATKGHREGVVPLRGWALAEIRAARLPASGWVFPRADGRPGPMTPARLSQLCNEHLHELGIAETLHSLRHRAGTQVLAATGNVRTAQEFLRHKSIVTTQVYTLVTNEQVGRAAGLLPAPRQSWRRAS